MRHQYQNVKIWLSMLCDLTLVVIFSQPAWKELDGDLSERAKQHQTKSSSLNTDDVRQKVNFSEWYITKNNFTSPINAFNLLVFYLPLHVLSGFFSEAVAHKASARVLSSAAFEQSTLYWWTAQMKGDR